MQKQYISPLMASIHETAEGLHKAGVIDMSTMREFDELCLTRGRWLKPPALTPAPPKYTIRSGGK